MSNSQLTFPTIYPRLHTTPKDTQEIFLEVCQFASLGKNQIKKKPAYLFCFEAGVFC